MNFGGVATPQPFVGILDPSEGILAADEAHHLTQGSPARSTAHIQEKAMLGGLGTARTCLHCMMLRVTERRLEGSQPRLSWKGYLR